MTESQAAPSWLRGVAFELKRNRQLIMHGQVNDRYWLEGEPTSLETIVTRYLGATGSQVVGSWDPVHGLVFQDVRQETAFRSHEHLSPDSRSTTMAAASAPSPAQRTIGLSSLDAEVETPPQDAVSIVTLADAIDAVAPLVADPKNPCAFVFKDFDAVLPPENSATATTYLRLRAAMHGAATPAPPVEGSPPYRRNAIICVTGDLARVPAWFYSEDPRLATLEIGRLSPAERRVVLAQANPAILGVTDTQQLEPLVGPTEGLSAYDLDALAATSILRNVTVHEPTRLMESFRFSIQSNPWEELNETTVRKAREALSERVIGQPQAIEAVARALEAAIVGIDFGPVRAVRPRGVFFFVGPTGVGKTELAKAVAALVFGDESAYARFDMSEYQEPHSAERFAGAPPGFAGHDEGGELTRRVQEQPFSVLLFDEVEKAHPLVLDRFLQILEDGRLTDGRGRTAYFSQCLIMFTSNEGSDSLHGRLFNSGRYPEYDEIRQHFETAVEAKFSAIGRPEIYGRLEPGVVVFDMLRPENVRDIAAKFLAQLAASALDKRGIVVKFDEETLMPWIEHRMATPESMKFGGRQIRNELEIVRHLIVAETLTGLRQDDCLVISARDGEVVAHLG